MPKANGPIEQASDYIFRVESDSDADKKYIVDLTPKSPPQCTCVAWVMKRNKTGTGHCKHIDYVRDFELEAGAVKKRSAAEQKKQEADEFERIRTIELLKATLEELEQ